MGKVLYKEPESMNASTSRHSRDGMVTEAFATFWETCSGDCAPRATAETAGCRSAYAKAS